MYKRKLKFISLVCFIACIVIWIPNLVFQIASPFWMLTFLIAPIGVILAILSKSYLLIFLNAVMIFSFFILMALGYIVNSQI